ALRARGCIDREGAGAGNRDRGPAPDDAHGCARGAIVRARGPGNRGQRRLQACHADPTADCKRTAVAEGSVGRGRGPVRRAPTEPARASLQGRVLEILAAADRDREQNQATARNHDLSLAGQGATRWRRRNPSSSASAAPASSSDRNCEVESTTGCPGASPKSASRRGVASSHKTLRAASPRNSSTTVRRSGYKKR